MRGNAPTATPFRTLLVANRGEIALRIVRSARAAGYRTVAVYSMADARGRHVTEADRAVCIGEALPSQSYLNIEAVIDSARRTGADAVHPGYGFLAENEAFARACRDAGLVFVGPSPEAIAAMGHKAAAKRLMAQAGVPCVPGYDGDDQGEARLAQEAERIGYPVMVKAVAGGGGRGMRRVDAPAQFADSLRSARSEALHAFGDGNVLIERAVDAPRHVEIQVFADRHGHAIHLGERDCSVQRRHQKLIEEAPSPAVGAALRERMGAAAVAAAKAIGYEGAGTLEFLLDRDGRFFFMEMNTRLQVEHPVTEAITGLDLVQLQLRVASGEPLPLRQEDVRFDGHAIEVRLCAEDAAAGFLPQSGAMALWQAPPGLRTDHALASGAEIPPYYDSMIAKVVAHGATRDEARRRLIRGLEETVALGVTTNQRFLAQCLAHPGFAAGEATTAFVDRHADELLAPDRVAGQRLRALAAALLAEGPGVPHRLAPRLPIPMRLEVDGDPFAIGVQPLGGGRHAVQVAGTVQPVEIVEREEHHVRFAVDGVVDRAAVVHRGDRLLLACRGTTLAVRDLTRAPGAPAGGASGGDGRVRASMNGRVVAVQVAVGDRVQAGQPLVTLEAMKMEHPHAAPVAGTVTALHVGTGQQVAAGRVVVEIEPFAAA